MDKAIPIKPSESTYTDADSTHTFKVMPIKPSVEAQTFIAQLVG